jgi:hypothetical protein
MLDQQSHGQSLYGEGKCQRQANGMGLFGGADEFTAKVRLQR